MDYFKLLEQVNIAQIVLILGGMWMFYNRLDAKIEKLGARMDKLEARMTALEHAMVEVKTILRFKECCMIKDDNQVKKAE